jgi:hypothetical protein
MRRLRRMGEEGERGKRGGRRRGGYSKFKGENEMEV